MHIYNERDDTFYANASYVSLHANGAGERRIRFPRRCRVEDALTGRRVALEGQEFRYQARNGETLILRRT
jgi:hypothetical protein